jgi:septal ring factor EnvC (AmiA/AmiB activator)
MSKNKKDELCGVCSKTVGKDGIQCEICEKWSHPACVDIAKEVYDSVSKNSQMHWYCMGCNAGASQMIKQLKKIQDRIETIDESFSKHKDEIAKESDKMDKNVKKFKEDLHGEIDRVTKQLQEVQKEVKSLKNNISESVDKTLISTVKEQEKMGGCGY